MHIAQGSFLQIADGYCLNVTRIVDDITNIDVEWFYLDTNGNVSNIHQSNTTLILQVVTRQDAGLYQCRAPNRIGNSSSTINVTIQCKTIILLISFDNLRYFSFLYYEYAFTLSTLQNAFSFTCDNIVKHVYLT